MRINQLERLTSGQDSDGVWHAFYASASRTLCNVIRPERGEDRHAHQPTCETCVSTAKAFDRIDASCPPHWFKSAVLEEREPEADGSAVSMPPGMPVLVAPTGSQPSRSSSTWRASDPDAILDAIRRWADTHDGLPPKTSDWMRATDDYPNFNCVTRAFGKWSLAIEAAGLDGGYWGRQARTAAGLALLEQAPAKESVPSGSDALDAEVLLARAALTNAEQRYYHALAASITRDVLRHLERAAA